MATVATTAAAVTTVAPAVTTAAPDTTAAAATTAAPDTTAAPAESTATTTATTTGASTAGAAAGTAVAVGEKEFSIDLAQTTFDAGTYTFNITNDGQFKHNLEIVGNGIDTTSDTFTAGQSGALTVNLTPGTYEVFCAIPTHKGKGMDMTITVK